MRIDTVREVGDWVVFYHNKKKYASHILEIRLSATNPPFFNEWYLVNRPTENPGEYKGVLNIRQKDITNVDQNTIRLLTEHQLKCTECNSGCRTTRPSKLFSNSEVCDRCHYKKLKERDPKLFDSIIKRR